MKPTQGITPLGRRGIALPVALLGLVAVSLLVTTALITSSAEVAVGTAHVDATRSLYAAEQGLNSYLLDVARDGATLAPGTVDWDSTGTGQRVRISVARMLELVDAADSSRRRTFAVTSEVMRGSAPGGRSVVAMVRQYIPPPPSLDLSINSALTLGGDLHVSGNAFTVSGNNGACMGGGSGVDALWHSNSSQITYSGGNNTEEQREQNFVGAGGTTGDAAIRNTHLSRSNLADSVLKHRTLLSIANQIPKDKWRWDGYDTVPTARRYSSTWLQSELGDTGAVVVQANGTTVSIQPGTYYGMLIILGGSVEIAGNVNFNGIIIAERNFTLSGSMQINGALISLAQDGSNAVFIDDSALGHGSLQVNFNKCEIQRAMRAFARDGTPSTPQTSTTFSWFEIVR